MAFYLKLLEKNIKTGVLHLTLPNGDKHTFGEHGPVAHWVVHDKKTLARIAKDWEFQFGETYMEGGWNAGDGTLADLIGLLRINFEEYQPSKWLQPFVRLTQQWNKVSRSYRNVAHHYDLDEAFFRLFLDEKMHYSCAYYQSENDDIEQAQQNKCQHIAKKLLLKPGMRVLDIGCGWGSLAIHLAEHHGVRVQGITLSKAQLAVAKRRSKERRLENLVQFDLCDYREHQQTYDRIVSVGMFEHVGAPFYQTYFDCVKHRLADDGAALIHTIGRSGPPGVTNPWIAKHIFPGGSIPALSETSLSIEKSGLMMTDTEILRLHYANTLRDWNARFQRHREAISKARGEQFCRMWEFYLVSCEIAFRYSDLVVFQLQLAKQHGVVPVTRDYLHPNPLLQDLSRDGQKVASGEERVERKPNHKTSSTRSTETH